MGKVTLGDISFELKLATSATKELVKKGIEGNDNPEFPKLFAKYKWFGTRDYNMALIIIALYTYCMTSKDSELKYYSAHTEMDRLIEGLKKGDGKAIYGAANYNSSIINEILKKAEITDKNKISKISNQFEKQVQKIKSWIINKSTMKSVAKEFKKQAYDKSAYELYQEISQIIKDESMDLFNCLDHYVLRRRDSKKLWQEINKKGNLLDIAFEQNDKYSNADTLLIYMDCKELLKASKSPNKKKAIFEILKGKVNNYSSCEEFVKKYDAISYLEGEEILELLLNVMRKNNLKLAKLFLENGVDPNVKDSKGLTVLHYAAYCGSRQMVELLLNHGANINAEDKNGSTPLQTAVSEEKQEIVELLLKFGAKYNNGFCEQFQSKLQTLIDKQDGSKEGVEELWKIFESYDKEDIKIDLLIN